MSEWDEFIVEEVPTKAKSPSSEWDEFIVEEELHKAPQGDNIATLIGKSILSGALELADLPQALFSLGEMGLIAPINALGGNLKPVIGSLSYPSEYVKDMLKNPSEYVSAIPEDVGIDIEPHPTTSGEKILSRGIRDAVGLATGAGLGAKFAKGIGRKLLGADEGLAKLAGVGGLTGANAEAAKELGANPIAAEIGSVLGTPSAIKGTKALAVKGMDLVNPSVESKLAKLGLSPKDFNIEAFEAAQNAGIELPVDVLSNSPDLKRKLQSLRKDAHFAEELEAPRLKAEEQARSKMDEILNEAGLPDTPETKKMFNEGYNALASQLPEDAMVNVGNILNKADSILKKYQNIPTGSNPGVEALLKDAKELKAKWNPDGLANGKILQPAEDVYTTLKTYNGSKRLWNMDGEAGKLGKELRHANKHALVEYGKKDNPSWHKAWRELDSQYFPMKNRIEVEDILNKSINHGTDSLSFLNLSKAINDPKKSKVIKELVGQDTFKKLQNLGETSKHIAQSSKKALNVAPEKPNTDFMSKLFSGAGGAALGALSSGHYGVDPAIGAMLGYGASAGANKVNQMMDQRFVNLMGDRGLIQQGYDLAKAPKATKQGVSFLENLGKNAEGAIPYASRAILDDGKKRKKLSDEEINKKLRETEWLTDEERQRSSRKVPTISSMPYVDVPTVGRR